MHAHIIPDSGNISKLIKHPLLVWQAPLVVRSAKRRHQSPEWTILSHSYRLIQGEIVPEQDKVFPYSCVRLSLNDDLWSLTPPTEDEL